MLDMRQALNAMEDSMRMQNYSRMQRRSEKAEEEEKEFREKLMRAAASKAEIDGIKSDINGSEAALQRDGLIAMLIN